MLHDVFFQLWNIVSLSEYSFSFLHIILCHSSFQQVLNESFLPLIGEKQTKFEHEIDKMEVKMPVNISYKSDKANYKLDKAG